MKTNNKMMWIIPLGYKYNPHSVHITKNEIAKTEQSNDIWKKETRAV